MKNLNTTRKQKPRTKTRQRAGTNEETRGGIRTAALQQMESYGEIWKIHEAVINLFCSVYRITQVSLMAE